MKEICLNILLIAIVCSIPLILAIDELSLIDMSRAYCFKFSWAAIDDTEKNNCTGQHGVPCIKPFYTDSVNITQLWIEKNATNFCPLPAAGVCIKYTTTYNNEIVNESFFCGKVTENKDTVITSGCYQKTKDGYTTEVCTCRSTYGTIPCNASVSIKYSNFILLIIFFVHAYKY
ncbi:uncharacterized protein LOC143359385 isoform X2 [Halictus rubicundus]|uniref:uncharacterized protein LOC143359385 isoform X2 n=1 Tax=Halictus rubicundus TaxID=77578 RepID=UPI004037528D